MPNVWTPVNQQGFDGWVMDYNANQAHAGQYRLHRANLRLEKFNPNSQAWSRWDVGPIDIPVVVASLTVGGSVPYDISFTPSKDAEFDVRARGVNLHFILPRKGFTMAAPIENSYYSLRFGSGFASLGGNLNGRGPMDTSMPVRLPLGSQSSSNDHAGFGIFHIFKVRGGIVKWDIQTLFSVIDALLSGNHYVSYRGTDSNGYGEWWIVGGERVRGLGGKSKDRSWQRWQLVLKQRDNYFMVQTLLNAADSKQFQQDVGIPTTL